MRTLLILICLTLYGCTEKVNWETLEKVYFFVNNPDDFESRNEDDLIRLPEVKELKIDIVKSRLEKSKYEGKRYFWKGGSYYAIAVFTGGETRKLKLSSNYGAYQDMKSGRYYSLEGYETIGSINWMELLKEE